MMALTRVAEQRLKKKNLDLFHSQTSSPFSSASSLQGRDPCEREGGAGWVVCPQVWQGSGFCSSLNMDVNLVKILSTCGPLIHYPPSLFLRGREIIFFKGILF